MRVRGLSPNRWGALFLRPSVIRSNLGRRANWGDDALFDFHFLRILYSNTVSHGIEPILRRHILTIKYNAPV